jgi:uncharacterized protein HemY
MINQLYQAHEEAQNLFNSTKNLEARDALSQCLTASNMIIPLYEVSTEKEREGLKQAVKDIVSMTQHKIEIALTIIEKSNIRFSEK